jgi:parallel beta-helix repeat protein
LVNINLNSKNLKIFYLIALISITSSSFFSVSNFHQSYFNYTQKDQALFLQAVDRLFNNDIYTVHSPILINSDSDFLAFSFNGEGTPANPYLIKSYNISSTGTSSMAIEIRDTHAYFIIQNCIVYSEYIGIGLNNISPNTSQILNNKIIGTSGDGGAILLASMQNSTIEKNTCTNFMQGIHLNYADHCKIINNYIYDVNYQGINLRYSGSNLIQSNTIRNAREHAIALVGTSDNNIIHHNTLDGNTWATSYNIDGQHYDAPSSQAYDEGSQNIWYDNINKEGNCWSDYFGIGTYKIDGPANSIDLYPSHTTGLTWFLLIVITSSIGVSLVGVIFSVRFYKKRRNSV